VLDIIKNCYNGIIVIDKNNGKIIYNEIKEPFKAFKINNIEELNNWFKNNYNKNAIPIFDEISKNNNRYWIIRKITHNHICYYIQELKYLNFILEEMEKKSIIDGLTGTYNKKEIEESLKKYLLIYLRYKKNPFSVIIFDIDFFKKVNDTYGHLAGDYILKELSKLIKEVIRDSDILGRFGGEEFMIILPETKVVGAIKLAKRLRKACEEHTFIFDGQKINITISLGVTSVTKTDFVESLIERCDTALYDAKKNGRNRVEYR
jgi:diguanylate cyclase (GGDEF)-like protein